VTSSPTMRCVSNGDERNQRRSFLKHGIDFAALDQMFAGDLVEEVDTRRDYGERRIKAIGEANGVIVPVVYTWRRRLISARKTRADERKEYQAKLVAG
jgi:uncharacterized protein